MRRCVFFLLLSFTTAHAGETERPSVIAPLAGGAATALAHREVKSLTARNATTEAILRLNAFLLPQMEHEIEKAEKVGDKAALAELRKNRRGIVTANQSILEAMRKWRRMDIAWRSAWVAGMLATGLSSAQLGVAVLEERAAEKIVANPRSESQESVTAITGS
ncbi:MAG: hypothetical protein HUU37_05420 [Bdellovibrionales bacterium]|nr:hypothetical protein [Bdellovibrionales bacterium]